MNISIIVVSLCQPRIRNSKTRGLFVYGVSSVGDFRSRTSCTEFTVLTFCTTPTGEERRVVCAR